MMELKLTSEQVELLLQLVGREADNQKENAALLRLYIRLLLQAQEQGIRISELPI